MIFTETELNGAFLIELEPFEDERGFFALSWSEKEFSARGMDARFVECNVSFNHKKGTLRGMHYQASPHGQGKLVRCTMGAVFDVMIDLRPSSPTFKHWRAFELTSKNHLALYVPVDFAHGFQTLDDNSEILYQMTTPYVPDSGRGLRWNDPAFHIDWPLVNPILNDRDKTYPDFSD